MSFIEVCIRRPVFTTVLSLLLIVVGVVSFSHLSIREMPAISPPVAFIQTTYDGASASVVESNITTPIEKALSSVSGIDEIHSKTTRGQSRVIVKFQLGADINNQVNDVRNAIERIRTQLPDAADDPQVMKVDPDAVQIMILSFSDSKLTPMALTDYVTRYIQPKLEQVNGVGQVQFFGARQYAMRIYLQPEQMAARQVTVSEVVTRLTKQNKSIASGQIRGENRYYTVIANGQLSSAAAFADLIVSDRDGKVVRLKDIAKVTIGPASNDGMMRVNGKPGIGLAILAQSTANPMDVAHQVSASMQHIKQSLPSHMHGQITYNNATFIHESIDNVYHSIFEAVILVIIVVLLFLGNVRSASIPIVTIPICLIAVFSVMLLLAYTLNTITLLAIVLAIGLVVDDAIVVVENIYRHIESGLDRFSAAIKGSKEIVFAVIAMTLTLAAVYAPVGFSNKVTGVLFQQFAYTLAAAVLISGFVALTLTPMMCARLLKPTTEKNGYSRHLERFFTRLIAGYKSVLRVVLRHKKYVFLLLIIMCAIGYVALRHLPQQLAPIEDEGVVMAAISAPTDASFKYTDRYVKQLEKIYRHIPEAYAFITMIKDADPTDGFSILLLKPWNQRHRSQGDIVKQLRFLMKGITGINVFPMQESPIGRGGGSGHHAVGMKLMTSSSYSTLAKTMKNFMGHVEKYPGLTNLDSSLKINAQNYLVQVNRDLAADLGIDIDDVNRTLTTMFGGSKATTFEYDGQSYDVILQLPDKHLKSLTVLQNIYVKNNKGKMIPLSNIASITKSVTPVLMPHYNRLRSDELEAELAPGYELGDAVNSLQQAATKYLPDTVQYRFTGSAKSLLEAKSSMAFLFGLALVFIYLVLSAQFESFLDPLIVLLSVPLSMIGALITLYLVGGSLNIYTEIGLVTLIGLMAKHGILITEFANQKRAAGLAMKEAIVEASALRLRPILMTTAAMVLGAIPLALASGAGAVARAQLGWVIVGGMLFGTFFSLFVVPSAYLALKSIKS